MSVHLDRQNRVIVEEIQGAVRELVAVYRFGSSSQGTTHSESDIDVAFLARGPLPPAHRFDVQERLAGSLGRDVDLVDLSLTSPVIAIQIVAHGQLLFEGDAAARGAFEDRTFGAYARLNEERRGILQRIAAEGTVYGR